jgi:hypothetical protein
VPEGWETIAGGGTYVLDTVYPAGESFMDTEIELSMREADDPFVELPENTDDPMALLEPMLEASFGFAMLEEYQPGEQRPTTIGGVEGAVMDYTAVDMAGDTIQGRIAVAKIDSNRIFAIRATTSPEGDWQQTAATFEQMLPAIRFLE